MENKSIIVTVCYASPKEQLSIDLHLPPGATIEDALNTSQILKQLQEPLDNYSVGIFARECPMDKVLKSGDRVEIYRPLPLSVQQARQKKVLANKT